MEHEVRSSTRWVIRSIWQFIEKLLRVIDKAKKLIRKADLGQYGFQWQATGQVKNTSDKALKDLTVNIQLIDSNGKIVGLIPTITNAVLLDLQPGQTTTFNDLLNGDDVNANAVALA